MSLDNALDRLDKTASAMEQKWGVGRLELLIDADLKIRFHRQADKLDKAIDSGIVSEIIRHADALAKGWLALDQAAIAAGHKPLDPDVWEIPLRNGRVAALVRSFPEAIAVSRQNRYVEVWTAQEIVNVIEAFPTLNQPAQSHSGTLVNRSMVAGSIERKKYLTDPDDEIPF